MSGDFSPDDDEETTSTARLIASLSSSYLYVRLQAVGKVQDQFLNIGNDGDAKPGPYKRLGRCIMSAFIDRQYNEKLFVAALAKAITVALTVAELPFDFKDFAADYISESKAKWLLASSKASGIELCLLVLSSTSSSKQNLSAKMPSWICDCIKITGSLLDNLSCDTVGKSGKLAQISSRLIGNLFRQDAFMLEYAIDCWNEASYVCSLSQLNQYFSSIPVITPKDGPVKRPKPVTPSYDSTLKRLNIIIIDLIIRKFLSSKQSLPVSSLKQLGGFLEQLSTSDWSDTIDTSLTIEASPTEGGGLEAATLRTMKKSPEASSAIIAAILTCVSVDLSNFVKCGAVAAALRVVKSPNLEVRESGSSIARNLAIKCTDPSSFEVMVKVFVDALQGKGPAALVQPYQRYGVYVAISDCAEGARLQSLGKGFVSELASGYVVPALIIAMDKEIDENNILVAADTLGKWMGSQLRLSQPPQLFESIKTGIGRSKGLCVAYLAAIAVAIRQNSELTGDLSALVSPLTNIVKETSKKPSNQSHLEGVLAFYLLLEISVTSSMAVTSIDAAKLWTCLVPAAVGNVSFLYSKTLMQQIFLAPYQLSSSKGFNSVQRQYASLSRGTMGLNSLVSESISSIVTIVSIHHPNQLVGTSASQTLLDGPVGSMLSCLLHPDSSVRAASSKNFRKVLCNGTAADDKSSSHYPSSLKMLKAFHACLVLWSEQLEAAMRAGCESAENKSAKTTIVTPTATDEEGTFTCGLMGLRMQLGIPPPSRLSEALLLLASPRLTDQRAHSAQLLSLFLLACAHPLVSETRSLASKLWCNLIPSVTAEEGKPAPELFSSEDFCSAASKKVVCAAMSREAKLIRQSGHVAMFILGTASGSSGRSCVLKYIIPQLRDQLISSGVSAVAEDEVEKFLNPLAAVTAATAAMDVSEADIKITNADRKKDSGRSRRGVAFGGDFVEDEDWAEKVKKEKAQKLALTKTVGQEGGMSVKLKELEDLRARVQGIVDLATYALEAYHSLTIFSVIPSKRALSSDLKVRAVARSSISQMLPELLSLLRCRLVSDKAFLCVLGQCLTIEDELLVVASRDLADSLRITATVALRPLTRKDNLQGQYKEMLGLAAPMQRLLRSVQTFLSRMQSHSHNEERGAQKEHRLLPSTVHLLFPILRGLLGLPTILPGCDFSFMILDSIWPRPSIFTIVSEPSAVETDGSDLMMLERSSAFSLMSLQKMVTQSCLSVLARLRVDPPPDVVLHRVVTQNLLFPALPVECSEGLDWITPLLGDLGLLSIEVNVQLACLNALHGVLILMSTTAPSPRLVAVREVMMQDSCVENRLWLARFNDDEGVRAMAFKVWELRGVTLSADYNTMLQPLLSYPGPASLDGSPQETSTGQHIRLAAARALSGAAQALPYTSEASILLLKSLYHSRKPVPTVTTGRALTSSSFSSGTVGKTKEGKSAIAHSSSQPAAVMIDAHVSTRLAIAEFIRSVGVDSAIPSEDGSSAAALDLLDFVLAHGTVDYSNEVRASMLTAGRALADSYGASMCRPMLSLLESVLLRKPASKSEEDLTTYDNRHQAAVVLMGAAGRHLSAEDPSVVGITESMVSALQTPSESVQKAVSDCLVQLVQVMKSSSSNNEKANEMLEMLMTSVLESETYGGRRGAAYGLGAFVKGLGIPSLKAHDIVSRLKEACTNGTVSAKQGALFAFECLSERLGLLFEPYVITIVPILLKSFSHASDHVREAAQGAAKVIMGRLSAHGVKQVLTPILTSLPEETQWKSRQEAIKLLGYMAHCAPKQLAACLPQIVPRLVEAGSDPHPKVKEGARAAMLDISSVIRNPEISRLAPVLLAAMADPSNKTKEALEALLECEFMHSIDAPSLALLVPILGRALRDRGADLKRKASAITGNMVSMVSDPKTLVPYLIQVLPGLKDCLLDPIPDVRATSAKALGSLVGGVGETELSDLVPWLMETLRSEASPVERSGAAQGLAEVCLALGDDRLEEILDTALALRNNARSAAREGLLWLLSFLPAVLAEGFSSHIKTTLPVILSGLSDESEGVREVALRSGQVMVTVLGSNNSLLLLPSLSEGMFDDDWRIRHSSLILLGDLLYLVGDTKAVGMADGEEEDEDLAGVSSGGKVTATLRANIGEKNANDVLAALYIVRSDVSMAVRQSALQVWKSVVSNTPRTLVEIIPILIQQLISKLSAESTELRVVAGKSLGELVRKMGDRVLPVVVPHLRKQLKASAGGDGDEALRQGVCLGLTEILAAASRRQVEEYLDSLMPALQEALCDKSEEVRSQAAKAFQTLFKNIGPRAVDDIVPALLARMGVMIGDSDDEDSEASDDDDNDEDNDDDDGNDDDLEDFDEDVDVEGDEESLALALLGLQGVVQLRPRDLMEYLLDPSCLLKHPMEAAAARTLAGVVQVAGTTLNYHFTTLIPALCMELLSAAEKVDKLQASVTSFLSGEGVEAVDATEDLAAERERLGVIKECAGAVMGAVTTTGVNFLSSELGRQIEHDGDVRRRRWGCWLLEQFVRRSKAVFSDYLPVLFKYLLSRVAEFDRELLQAVCDALLALSTCVPLEELSIHLDFIRSCVNSTASDARHRVGAGDLFNSVTGVFTLPLLTVPKSLESFLTIALHGLMNGSLQARETAADVIAELAAMADPIVLKPYLIKTTGPLIRVVGDRFPSNVKAAILQTLAVLLDKGGASLKAFAPQLQTTFIKSLSDPSKIVRQRGSTALGKLMALNARVDPLLIELATCTILAEGPAIKASTLEALAVVLSRGGGEKASPASIEKVRNACLSSLVEGDDENVRAAAAICASALTTYMDSATISDMLIDLCEGSSEVGTLCGRILGTGAVLQTAGQRALEVREEAYAFLSKGLKDERAAVKSASCSALISMFTVPPLPVDAAAGTVDVRKGEYRAAAQGALHAFAALLSAAAGESMSADVRKVAMSAIKQAAKSYPIASQLYIQQFMPPLIVAVKDINIRLKYIAERAMKYLLDGGENATILSAFAAGTDTESARFVREYARRSLCRLPADSDDESADKW